jgi:hypothetical protein
MFKLTYLMEEIGEYATFDAAFRTLYQLLVADMKKGISWQVVETAIWIQRENSSPIYFYDARDMARRSGLLKEGKLT